MFTRVPMVHRHIPLEFLETRAWQFCHELVFLLRYTTRPSSNERTMPSIHSGPYCTTKVERKILPKLACREERDSPRDRQIIRCWKLHWYKSVSRVSLQFDNLLFFFTLESSIPRSRDCTDSSIGCWAYTVRARTRTHTHADLEILLLYVQSRGSSLARSLISERWSAPLFISRLVAIFCSLARDLYLDYK